MAHLGTGAREDSGHLPIELLGSPKAAGLVEKGVDWRDRAAVTRRDLSEPAPKSRSTSSVPPRYRVRLNFHFTGEDRRLKRTHRQRCTHRTACAADRQYIHIHTQIISRRGRHQVGRT